MKNDPVAARLRQLLLTEFTEAELAQLCKELGMNYENLQGIGLFGKTRALIEEARSRGKLRLLQRRVRDLRPLAYFQAGFASEEEPLDLHTKHITTRRRQSSSSRRTLSSFFALLVGIGIVVIVFLLLPLTLRSTSTSLSEASSAATTSQQEGKNLRAPEVAEPLSTAMPLVLETATPDLPSSSSSSLLVATPEPAAQTSASDATPPVVPTLAAHPAVDVIYQANEQLKGFFQGQEDIRALEAYWEPDLVEQLSNFAGVRLMRLMRLAPNQRSALRVQMSYVKPPALLDEVASKNEVVVSAREYWEYTTEVNRVRLCETRDYQYWLRKTDDRFRIYAYTGRLISSRCQ